MKRELKTINGAELKKLLAMAADPKENVIRDGDLLIYWDLNDPDDGFAGVIGVVGDLDDDS